MRIGIFTNSYHPAIHGVVRSVDIFRRELTALGHEVFVFCPADETFEDNDPAVFRYPSLANYADMDCRIPVPRSLTMDHVIRGLNLDIIHSQHPIYIGFEASRQARRNGIPVVFTWHSLYDDVVRRYVKWPDWFYRAWMNWLHEAYLSGVDSIIAPTESVRQIIAVRQPRYAHLAHVLPTPLDPSSVIPHDPGSVRARHGLAGTFTFISVTRLAPEKNLDALVRAFSLIAHELPQTRLVLVGSGLQRRALESLVKALGIAAQVVMPGMIAMDKVPDYLGAADAYVCASQTETQGMALIEAMAVGLPCAVMDAPGSRDVITNEVDGLLTAPDPEALAAGMRRLVLEEELRLRLGVQARQVIQRYDPRQLTIRLLAVYRQAISACRPLPMQQAAYSTDSTPAE